MTMSSSFSVIRKISAALPKWAIKACAVFGSNPKILLRAQRLYVSSMFSMPAK